MILQVSDFANGITSISGTGNNDYAAADFETYLSEETEHKYIYHILGSTLGQEFIDDLTGTPQVPTHAKFQTIFSHFFFDFGTSKADCKGLKEILIYLFYRDYVNGQPIRNSITGNVSTKGEATSPEGLVGRSTIIYNRAVNEIDKLQYYVSENSDTYTDFGGVIFTLQTGF